MSLYGAMMIGVSGLAANSTALSVSSSNIANANTVGYKAGQNSFSSLLASSGGAGDISSQGVVALPTQNVTLQGLVQSTSVPTDMAISGNGFFVVNQRADGNGATYYTRAGNFTPDANGNLKNASGLYLMGWPVDSSGNTPSDPTSLTPVNVSALSGYVTDADGQPLVFSIMETDYIENFSPKPLEDKIAVALANFSQNGGVKQAGLNFHPNASAAPVTQAKGKAAPHNIECSWTKQGC